MSAGDRYLSASDTGSFDRRYRQSVVMIGKKRMLV